MEANIMAKSVTRASITNETTTTQQQASKEEKNQPPANPPECIPAKVLKEMRAELSAGMAKGIEMLKHFHRFGTLLTHHKAAIPHGNIEKWYMDTFNISKRRGQRYQQLATIDFAAIEKAGCTGLNEALELVIQPGTRGQLKAKPEQGTTTISTGNSKPVTTAKPSIEPPAEPSQEDSPETMVEQIGRSIDVLLQVAKDPAARKGMVRLREQFVTLQNKLVTIISNLPADWAAAA